MKRKLVAGCICLWLGASMPLAHAERLTGTNWISGTLSYLNFDDLGPIDNGWSVDVLGNANVTDHVDVQGGFGYAWADDGGANLDVTTVSGDAIYSFKPGSNINPFARGGVLLAFTDVDLGIAQEDDTEFGIGGGIGAELTVGTQGVLQVEGDYFVIDGDGGFSIDGRYAHAFTPRLLGRAGMAFDFDSDTLAITFGVIYRVGH
jgi:hypothetical protein